MTFGSAVARTPAASVICGTGVGRSVGVGVGRGVAVGVPLVRGCVALARGVAVGEGDGVGGGVGASVRNGAGAVVGSGSGSDGDGFSATGGCSGAFGFFGCASAYVVEPSIARPVIATATRRSAQAGMS